MSQASLVAQPGQRTDSPSASQHKKLNWSALPEDIFNFMEVRTASNCAAYLLPILQETKQSNRRCTVLDVGAGSGSMAPSFARFLGPDGHLTAVDSADAYKLPFEDGTFDVVHCHQFCLLVLVHNKNPVDILREMMRVTKPGGVVAAREGDPETEVLWPPLSGILKFHHEGGNTPPFLSAKQLFLLPPRQIALLQLQ